MTWRDIASQAARNMEQRTAWRRTIAEIPEDQLLDFMAARIRAERQAERAARRQRRTNGSTRSTRTDHLESRG